MGKAASGPDSLGPPACNWLALPHASLTAPRAFRKKGNEAALCGQGGCQHRGSTTPCAGLWAALVPSEDTRRGPERHSSLPHISQHQPLLEPPAPVLNRLQAPFWPPLLSFLFHPGSSLQQDSYANGVSVCVGGWGGLPSPGVGGASP